jgi:ribosomal-protein-alanine N-acetyltransferase
MRLAGLALRRCARLSSNVRRHRNDHRMRLQTEVPGCSLRSWSADDVSSLVANANDRAVWRNLTDMFPHPYTEDDAKTWIVLANEDGPSVHLAIEVSGQAVGGMGALAGNGIAVKTAQFGYWLGRSHWGKGLATAAASAMRRYLLRDDRFARLEAPVFAWNPASMRVLEKAGFIREGTLKNSVFKEGQLIDSVMFAAYRSDA